MKGWMAGPARELTALERLPLITMVLLGVVGANEKGQQLELALQAPDHSLCFLANLAISLTMSGIDLFGTLLLLRCCSCSFGPT